MQKEIRKSSTFIVKAASRASGVNSSYIKTLNKRRTEGEIEILKQDISTDDHIISLEALQARYSTDLKKGLTREQAGELLRKNGPNCLIPPTQTSLWLKMTQYIFGGFAILLWSGALLAILSFIMSYYHDKNKAELDHIYLAVMLIVIVIFTGVFAYIQEAENVKIMESFSKMIPKVANVIREGEMVEIPAEELVVGDLVGIAGGDCVPADIRILECSGLKVDNSAITGESDYQSLMPICTDVNPLETKNMAFFGTNVIEGAGEGIVVACGDDTLIGHIAGLAATIQPEELPIKKELKQFIRIISILAIGTGSLFFIIALSIGYHFLDACIYFIAIVIGNVPEGMLVTLTACLTLTAKKMFRKNCLVKNLQVIETLGSTNVICSDKTGTLTQNRMTAAHMFYDDYIVETLGIHLNFERTVAFELLCRVGILCNRAEFKSFQDDVPVDQREAVGNASEIAVLKLMENLKGNVRLVRAELKKVCEIPFNSDQKFQLSIHYLKTEGQHLLVMKGAPEVIISHCITYFTNGTEKPLNNEKVKELHAVISKFGYMGERVLGFADLLLPAEVFPQHYAFDTEKINFPIDQLRFVGLISMIDPPRPAVSEAVAKCRNAGIKIIMVTGDHPITAISIARKVGIISPKNETIYDIAAKQNLSLINVSPADIARCNVSVITGTSLREMSQNELDKVLKEYQEIIFARTSPQQKLKIVESLQRLNHIVAVTGDGVNDSPALKKADIGVAMGISGSEVSKQAADIIILDDNFASIVTGIEEGRLVFDNLKKSIAYVLTSNVPEIMPFMLFVIINIPQVISILSIIIIDVGTDLWPAISLAYEHAESDIMNRKPRDAKVDKLINSRIICFTYFNIGIIQTCAGFTSYFIMMAQHGFFYDRLIGIREEWEDESINNLIDSYGQLWTYDERKVLDRKAYSTYFMSIVITQVADAFIAKTRKLSIFQQGLSNWMLNFGIIFELILAACVIYVPGLNRALGFESLHWFNFLPAVPYAILIIVFDECRKFLIRKYPQSWLDKNTYY